MDKPLNVLHIMADQLVASALRAYGNKVCRTPHIDSLAARGALFENFYCNFPLCAPSRASMLTGRQASRLGVFDNACDFPSQAPTLPHYLSALGYHTVLSGKMHFIGADQLHGYQERLTTDIYPSDFGWTPDWKKSIPVASTGVSLRSVVEAGTCKRSLQLDFDDDVANKSVQWIYDYGRQSDRPRPFFHTVSMTHPHNPYVTTQPYWDLYKHEDVDMPRVGRIAYKDLDAHSQRLFKAYKFGEYTITDEDVRRSRHAYYGMTSYIDDQVGRLLGALRDMDLEKNTAVIFHSDHGDMLGERGLWYKWMHFEGACRIPMIVAMPGAKASRVQAPSSLLDFLPTVVEIASSGDKKIEPVTPLEGVSLMPAVNGAELPYDRPVFAEMNADGTHSPSFMVRKGDWKIVACEGDPTMLFDLRNDPDEMKNLAGTPDTAKIEAELMALVNSNWSPAALKTEMQESSKRRLFVQAARDASGAPAWDYEPRKDASKQFVRGGGDAAGATATKGRARYPFVPAKTPDNST